MSCTHVLKLECPTRILTLKKNIVKSVGGGGGIEPHSTKKIQYVLKRKKTQGPLKMKYKIDIKNVKLVNQKFTI